MSNRRIDKLFYDRLVEGLTTNGKLDIAIMRPSIILSVEQARVYDSVSQIVASLIPAPAETQTLGGDHKRFTGIYQVDVKVFMNSDDYDADTTLYDIQDKLQDIFEVDMVLSEPGFSVQVISPLKASGARQFKQWWTCHCYFNYRADTN